MVGGCGGTGSVDRQVGGVCRLGGQLCVVLVSLFGACARRVCRPAGRGASAPLGHRTWCLAHTWYRLVASLGEATHGAGQAKQQWADCLGGRDTQVVDTNHRIGSIFCCVAQHTQRLCRWKFACSLTNANCLRKFQKFKQEQRNPMRRQTLTRMRARLGTGRGVRWLGEPVGCIRRPIGQLEAAPPDRGATHTRAPVILFEWKLWPEAKLKHRGNATGPPRLSLGVCRSRALGEPAHTHNKWGENLNLDLGKKRKNESKLANWLGGAPLEARGEREPRRKTLPIGELRNKASEQKLEKFK